MSLIRIRRERKQETTGGPARPARLWKLLLGAAIVFFILYYLSRIV